jgi:hypothetical protein
MKAILVENELHTKLKEYSKKSGIKIKNLVEIAIESYLKKISFKESEEKNDRKN